MIFKNKLVYGIGKTCPNLNYLKYEYNTVSAEFFINIINKNLIQTSCEIK